MALGLRDVVVLPPSPHQPCVLRPSTAPVTVAAVKDRLFHRRGWRPEAQVLRLEGQRDEVSDGALLQALGGARAPVLVLSLGGKPITQTLGKAMLQALASTIEATETLKHRASTIAAEAARAEVPLKSSYPPVDAVDAGDAGAAAAIQAAARSLFARHRVRQLRRDLLALALGLHFVCARVEWRAAVTIQERWRWRRFMRAGAAAVRAPGVAAARPQRPARAAAAAAGARAAAADGRDAPDAARRAAEGDGVPPAGRWQLITWQDRYVFATPTALCWQHVAPLRPGGGGGEPKGPVSQVPFTSMRRVGVQEDDRTCMLIECAGRHYCFRFRSQANCSAWASVLCAAHEAVLATLAAG